MGVIGLDLRCSDLGGVPRKLGWPRQKSRHKLNANEKTLMFSEVEGQFTGVAPVGGSAVMAPVVAMPVVGMLR